MEILFILLLAAVFVFATRTRQRHQSKAPPTQTPTKPKTSPKPFTAATAKPVKEIIRGRAYVVDGDTITIKKTQIRLFGVDAPEINHPYGKKAKWALVALCKGQTVRAEIIEKDAHERTVA